MAKSTKSGKVWRWDGALVSALREARPSPLRPGERMSRNDVVAALGLANRETVRRWEISLEDRVAGNKSSSRPSGDDIGRLATLLGCEPSDFYREVAVDLVPA